MSSNERDGLSQTATDIAIDLINAANKQSGDAGSLYLSGMKRLFRSTPALVEDVDAEYRQALQSILDKKD